MTTEQDKAYEAWWSDPASPNNTKDIFVAGWEAHAAATANSRTAERSSSEQAARQIESALKLKFSTLASTAFLAGHDDKANIYRNIANHLI